MRVRPTFQILWLAAGLALFLGAGRDTILGLIPKPRELPRLDRATGQPWIAGDFTGQFDYQTIAEVALPTGIKRASSWQGTDAFQGKAESAWFSVTRSVVHVGVAGYPQHAGCSVVAEFRSLDGKITRLTCPLSNPKEQWRVWEIDRPPDALAVRMIVEDRASDYTGWVAVTHPFRAWPSILPIVFQHLQLYTTVALALVLIWGPGLVWYPRTAAPEIRALFLVGNGPLVLAMLGAVVWCLGGKIAPGVSGFVGAAVLWLTIGIGAKRRGFQFEVSPTMFSALALSALVVVAVTAKSTYSVGPAGELYRGTISRNYTVGDRMDSRFPFFIVQAVARHSGPAAPETEQYFRPWTFFSRGPLAGLAAVPIVMGTGGRPPVERPEQPWQPFDPQGFAAYRVTLMTLASGVVVAFCGLLLLFVPPSWALTGAGLLALSPFGVHEIMFTWPKWAATAWLIAAFSLAHTRRPFAAGLTLGVGFLFHPLVMLWTPWIGLWAVGRTKRTFPEIARAGLRFGSGAALLVIPWMLAGVVAPHQPEAVLAGQGGFLRYWLLADRQIATWATWCHTRWLNLANTFVPLHVYLSADSFHHARAGSAYEPSGRLVKFAAVWWNTLPFGLGLGLWALSVAAIARAWQALRAAVVLFIIGPALLVTANWGWDPLGLMRECGHPLFVAVIAITCVFAANSGGWISRLLSHCAVPWLQLPETLLMLWLTTLANPLPWPVDFGRLDPLCLAINALALGAAVWVLFQGRTRPVA